MGWRSKQNPCEMICTTLGRKCENRVPVGNNTKTKQLAHLRSESYYALPRNDQGRGGYRHDREISAVLIGEEYITGGKTADGQGSSRAMAPPEGGARGQQVFKLSRVGSGRVGLGWVGSGALQISRPPWPDPTPPDPRGLT